jgi:hypothetical protein
MDNNRMYDELKTEIGVARAQDSQSSAAKLRMEKKQMTKFEKIWRQKSNVKASSSKKSAKEAKNQNQNQNTSMAGKELKRWMKKNKIFELALYQELVSEKITDVESLKAISESKFDAIVGKVRVDRFSQLKDDKSRNRVDKLLIAFEKQWRQETGNSNSNSNSNETGDTRTEETKTKTNNNVNDKHNHNSNNNDDDVHEAEEDEQKMEDDEEGEISEQNENTVQNSSFAPLNKKKSKYACFCSLSFGFFIFIFHFWRTNK